MQSPVKGVYRSPEERERENLRVRAKYAQRAHQRKVELYFKALDIVRQKEQCTDRQLTFSVKYASQYGERVVLVGDIPILGNWIAANGVPMNWNEGCNWSVTLTVPYSTHTLHYKYVVVTDGAETNRGVKWEWGNNHRLEIGEGDASPCNITDEWGAGTSPA
ncbi:starch-binding domain protein [Gregarina niphandrodes]|uniref:Starch-binding domain protein n=1 Tax=Gregarina niphandrodes TaxID=110365 RepID=A0A023B7S2_GRENI|nr:starch-binding domain protein [Gregarina niphandrodes]EZG67635.1 starch-binding domain protein [Gregarina niphandrodes]|eukprot:XP_011130188.1 starch-binding domain protein [Gregarina niphandrodes]